MNYRITARKAMHMAAALVVGTLLTGLMISMAGLGLLVSVIAGTYKTFEAK